VVIRGHEPIACGVKESFNQTVLTVFSASNFCGVSTTESGVIQILYGPNWEKYRLPPLPMIRRKDVQFTPLNAIAGRQKWDARMAVMARKAWRTVSSSALVQLGALKRNSGSRGIARHYSCGTLPTVQTMALHGQESVLEDLYS
jgi:hypothetical protein